MANVSHFTATRWLSDVLVNTVPDHHLRNVYMRSKGALHLRDAYAYKNKYTKISSEWPFWPFI